MQISLQEDDSLFHGGTPQLVVLVVKFDNGNTKRIPYEACKTIASLYQDLYAIAPQVNESKVMENIGGGFSGFEDGQGNIQENLIPKVMKNFAEAKAKATIQAHKEIIDKSFTIEKEDIVTLIKLNPREFQSGTVSPLIVGMDYRVLKLKEPVHQVNQYQFTFGHTEYFLVCVGDVFGSFLAILV